MAKVTPKKEDVDLGSGPVVSESKESLMVQGEPHSSQMSGRGEEHLPWWD